MKVKANTVFSKDRPVWTWLFMLCTLFSFSQTIPNSLRKEIELIKEKSNKNDTARVLMLEKIAAKIQLFDIDSSLKYYRISYTLSRQCNYPLGLAQSYHGIGTAKCYYSDIDSALYYFEEARKINKQLNNKKNYSNNLSGIARAYYLQSKFSEAIKYYLDALRITEEIKDKLEESICLGNIALVHYEMQDHSVAYEYIVKALKIDSVVKDEAWFSLHQGSLGNILQNQANILYTQSKIAEAKIMFERSKKAVEIALSYALKVHNKNEAASRLTTLGNIHHAQGDTLGAIELYKQALRTEKETRHYIGMAAASCNLGWLCYEERNYKDAEQYSLEAIEYAKRSTSLYLLNTLYDNLTGIYEDSHQYEKALASFKKFMQAKDSIFNIENSKKIITTEMNFDMEKKEALMAESANKQKTIRNSFVFGFTLMLSLVIVAYRGYLQKKKINALISRQKTEVEKQKEMVEVKNKEVLDSIHYAKRIQQSLLPSENVFEKGLKRS